MRSEVTYVNPKIEIFKTIFLCAKRSRKSRTSYNIIRIMHFLEGGRTENATHFKYNSVAKELQLKRVFPTSCHNDPLALSQPPTNCIILPFCYLRFDTLTKSRYVHHLPLFDRNRKCWFT